MKYRLTRGDIARRGGVLVAVALAHIVVVLGLLAWVFEGPKLPPMMVTSVTEEAAPPPVPTAQPGIQPVPRPLYLGAGAASTAKAAPPTGNTDGKARD